MRFKLFAAFTILSLIFLTSCNKDNDDPIIEVDTDDIEMQLGATLGNKDCFELVYPISAQMPDGTILTGSSEEELESIIKDWYEKNPEGKEDFELVYPFDIIFEDEQITIQNADELKRFKLACKEEGEDGETDFDCVKLIYPVSYTMPDGLVIKLESEDDWDLIKAWYEANKDSEEKPSLIYPIEVEFEEEVFTIANEDELNRLKEACKDGWGDDEYKDCFTLLYPYSYTMPDGSTITINDEDDLKKLRAWYETNPDSEGEPILNYPVEVKFDDEVLTVGSDEELDRLEESCEDKDDEDGGHNGDDDKDEEYDCLELLYPHSYTMPDGSSITLTKDDDWDLIIQWYENNPGFNEEPILNFPVDVKFDGEELTLQTREEMYRFLKACEDMKDEDEKNDDSGDQDDNDDKFDCEELKANIGDECRTKDGEIGTITEDCKCE